MAPCVFDMETVGVLQAFTRHVHIIERAKLSYEVIVGHPNNIDLATIK